MFVRQEYLQQINASLAQVAHELEGAVALQFTDANVTAEDFFVGLLNAVMGRSFVNANLFQANSPGIDLADRAAKVSCQVTSDTELSKVRKTLKVFAKENLHEKYSRLIFVYPSMDRPRRRKKTLEECPKGFSFDLTKDEYCFKDVLGLCRNLQTAKLRELSDWLSAEVQIGAPRVRPSTDQTVMRIINLIEHLTAIEPTSSLPEPDSVPDPNGKFLALATYADYLKSQYIDHASSYVPVEEAKSAIGYDGVRARRIAAHLKQRSRSLLRQNGGDAEQAFEALVTELQVAVASSKTRFETSAIRYFLATEMIACNVFPLNALPPTNVRPAV